MKVQQRTLSYFLHGISVVFLIVGSAAFIKNIFSVQTITCMLDDGSSCPPSLISSLEQLKNKPMFFSQLPQVIRHSTDTGGYTLKSLHKKLPNTVLVQFIQAKPLYQLQLGENRYTADVQGFLQLSTGAPGLLVTFAEDTPLQTPNQLDQTVHTVLYTMVQESSTAELPLTGIYWKSNQEIELTLEGNRTALLDNTDTAVKIQTLAQVLKSDEFTQATQNLGTSYSIDMRFRLPVLRTGQ